MSRHEGLALILSATDYRESSSLLQVLSPDEGRISLIAKGSRPSGKAKARTSVGAMLQPFSLVYLDYTLKDEKSLGTINQAEIERIWKAPRENLTAYAMAAYWFEILKTVSQARSQMPEMFQQTTEFMEYLEDCSNPGLQYLVWLSDLSVYLGFRWNYQACSRCGNKLDYTHPIRFSLKSGFICHHCLERHEGMAVTDREKTVLKSLQDARSLDVALYQKEFLDILGLLNRFLMYHLEGPLKSFEFLQRTLS